MTIEELNEQWPEYDIIVTKDVLPFVTLNREEYNAARSALLNQEFLVNQSKIKQEEIERLEEQIRILKEDFIEEQNRRVQDDLKREKLKDQNKQLKRLCYDMAAEFGKTIYQEKLEQIEKEN